MIHKEFWVRIEAGHFFYVLKVKPSRDMFALGLVQSGWQSTSCWPLERPQHLSSSMKFTLSLWLWRSVWQKSSIFVGEFISHSRLTLFRLNSYELTGPFQKRPRIKFTLSRWRNGTRYLRVSNRFVITPLSLPRLLHPGFRFRNTSADSWEIRVSDSDRTSSENNNSWKGKYGFEEG